MARWVALAKKSDQMALGGWGGAGERAHLVAVVKKVRLLTNK
jgi:hypothetical protein